MEALRGPALVLAGSTHPGLARQAAVVAGAEIGNAELDHYPDAELVILQSEVRGRAVYIVQPTSPPPEPALFELLLIADAARRAGAASITAVMPYFGYARQDRRAEGRRAAIGARVAADMLATRVDHLVTVDLHTAAIEGFFSMPVEHLEAFPLLVREAGDVANGVVVAPDLGASKLAERYGRALGLPVAVVHKQRLSGTEVAASSVTGPVASRQPIVVDDIITTGGTIAAALAVVRGAGALMPATVLATHATFAPGAPERLAAAGVTRLVVTDSVAVNEAAFPGLQIVSLAPLLGEALRRLHENESLAGLRARV